MEERMASHERDISVNPLSSGGTSEAEFQRTNIPTNSQIKVEDGEIREIENNENPAMTFNLPRISTSLVLETSQDGNKEMEMIDGVLGDGDYIYRTPPKTSSPDGPNMCFSPILGENESGEYDLKEVLHGRSSGGLQSGSIGDDFQTTSPDVHEEMMASSIQSLRMMDSEEVCKNVSLLEDLEIEPSQEYRLSASFKMASTEPLSVITERCSEISQIAKSPEEQKTKILLIEHEKSEKGKNSKEEVIPKKQPNLSEIDNEFHLESRNTGNCSNTELGKLEEAKEETMHNNFYRGTYNKPNYGRRRHLTPQPRKSYSFFSCNMSFIKKEASMRNTEESYEESSITGQYEELKLTSDDLYGTGGEDEGDSAYNYAPHNTRRKKLNLPNLLFQNTTGKKPAIAHTRSKSMFSYLKYGRNTSLLGISTNIISNTKYPMEISISKLLQTTDELIQKYQDHNMRISEKTMEPIEQLEKVGQIICEINKDLHEKSMIIDAKSKRLELLEIQVQEYEKDLKKQNLFMDQKMSRVEDTLSKRESEDSKEKYMAMIQQDSLNLIIKSLEDIPNTLPDKLLDKIIRIISQHFERQRLEESLRHSENLPSQNQSHCIDSLQETNKIVDHFKSILKEAEETISNKTKEINIKDKELDKSNAKIRKLEETASKLIAVEEKLVHSFHKIKDLEIILQKNEKSTIESQKDLNNKLSNKNDKIAELEEEVRQLRRKEIELIEGCNNEDRRRRLFEQKLEPLNAYNKTIEQQKERMMKEYEDQINQLKQEITNTQSNLEEKKKKIEDLQSEISTLNEKITNLIRKEGYADLEESKIYLEREGKEIKEKLLKDQKENNELKQKLEELKNEFKIENNKLKNSIDDYKTIEEMGKRKINQQGKTTFEQNTRIQKLNEELDSLKQISNKRAKFSEELVNKNKKICKDLLDSKNNMRKYKMDLEEKSEDLVKLRNENHKKEICLQNLQKVIDELKSEEAKVSEVRRSNKIQELHIKEREDRIEQEREDLKIREEDTEKRVRKYRQLNTRTQNEKIVITQRSSQLECKENKNIYEQRMDRKRLDDEWNKILKEKNRMKREKESLNRENKIIEADKKRLEQKYSELEYTKLDRKFNAREQISLCTHQVKGFIKMDIVRVALFSLAVLTILGFIIYFR